MCDPSVRLPVYEDARADAVFELADLTDGAFAMADCVYGAEGSVDDTDVGWRGLVRELPACCVVAAMGLAGEM